jgi:hypothetical protein
MPNMTPTPANNPTYPRSLFPNAVDVINDLATPAVSDAIGAVQSQILGAPGTTPMPVTAASVTLGGAAGVHLLAGTGVPAAGLGANGDYYFRQDGAATAHIYFKSAGAWAGLV